MMGVHGVAAVHSPLPVRCNVRAFPLSDGFSAVQNISVNQRMNMASFLLGGRYFQFAAKQTFSCQQSKSLQASVKEDGWTSPGNSTLEASQGRVSDLWERVPQPVRKFPWKRFCIRFIERMLDLLWKITKWLAIPVLILSSLGEFLYTLSAKKDICIPLGIITGVLVARTGGKTVLDVLNESQDGKFPWPLVVMGMLFILLKLPGPYYSSWAAACFPHFANGGLVQTVLLFREWKRMSA